MPPCWRLLLNRGVLICCNAENHTLWGFPIASHLTVEWRFGRMCCERRLWASKASDSATLSATISRSGSASKHLRPRVYKLFCRHIKLICFKTPPPPPENFGPEPLKMQLKGSLISLTPPPGGQWCDRGGYYRLMAAYYYGVLWQVKIASKFSQIWPKFGLTKPFSPKQKPQLYP